jgi:hypothetical protein
MEYLVGLVDRGNAEREGECRDDIGDAAFDGVNCTLGLYLFWVSVEEAGAKREDYFRARNS